MARPSSDSCAAAGADSRPAAIVIRSGLSSATDDSLARDSHQRDWRLGVVVDLDAPLAAGLDARGSRHRPAADAMAVDLQLNHRDLVAGPRLGALEIAAEKHHRPVGD